MGAGPFFLKLAMQQGFADVRCLPAEKNVARPRMWRFPSPLIKGSNRMGNTKSHSHWNCPPWVHFWPGTVVAQNGDPVLGALNRCRKYDPVVGTLSMGGAL